jgi:hypothetical protein
MSHSWPITSKAKARGLQPTLSGRELHLHVRVLGHAPPLGEPPALGAGQLGELVERRRAAT